MFAVHVRLGSRQSLEHSSRIAGESYFRHLE